MAKDWDEEFELGEVVGGGRLGTGVKKAWMLGGEVKDRGEGDGGEEREDGNRTNADRVRTFCIEWAAM